MALSDFSVTLSVENLSLEFFQINCNNCIHFLGVRLFTASKDEWRNSVMRLLNWFYIECFKHMHWNKHDLSVRVNLNALLRLNMSYSDSIKHFMYKSNTTQTLRSMRTSSIAMINKVVQLCEIRDFQKAMCELVL